MSNYTDKYYLQETLRLAKKGMGTTNPNPMVGAVIVKNGQIIGKGYHKKAGSIHAEIEALNSVSENPKGATIYVNLEPCSHYGKTPPCIDAILVSGISKVICCTPDPNPIVKGEGIKRLKEAGIFVSVGELQKEARELNEIFFTFHEKKRPFIALKYASSLDGKIATNTHDSKWITNEKARRFARNLRSQYQSVLVGINTIIEDDPYLGLQIKGKTEPLRIILDSSLRIPLDSKVLRNKNILIVTTTKADKDKEKLLKKMDLQIIKFESESISIPELLNQLTEMNITSIYVEGGSQVLGSFIDEQLVDRIYVFQAPIIIGGQNAINAIGGTGVDKIKDAMQFKNITLTRFGDNVLTTGVIES